MNDVVMDRDVNGAGNVVGESAVAEGPSPFPPRIIDGGISPFISISAGKNICDFGSPYRLSLRIIRYQMQIDILS
jgi:hypothetical protein